MKLKSKLTMAASGLLLASSVFAGSKLVCPNIADIQDEPLTMTEVMSLNYYISYNISDYNTNSLWVFGLAPIEGDNAADALDLGNELLSSVTGPGVPQDATTCLYNTGNKYLMAIAVKASQGVSKLKQYAVTH